jgi:hypothetical protein
MSSLKMTVKIKAAILSCALLGLGLSMAAPMNRDPKQPVRSIDGFNLGDHFREKGFPRLAFSAYRNALIEEDSRIKKSMGFSASTRSPRQMEKISQALDEMVKLKEEQKGQALPPILSLLYSDLKKLNGGVIGSTQKGAGISVPSVRYLFVYTIQEISKGAEVSELLLSLLKASPPHAYIALAIRDSRDGNFKAARDHARRALPLLKSESADAAAATPSELLKFGADLRLIIARSEYALGEMNEAIQSYESLFQSGLPVQDALIESAWSRLRLNQYGKAIGLSYELETGKMARFFAPEASSVRAIALLENCRYAEAKRSIERFAKIYGPVASWLNGSARFGSLYELALKRAEKKIGGEQLPESIWSVWSSSDLFLGLQTDIQRSFEEERALREWLNSDEAKANPLLAQVARQKTGEYALDRARNAERIEKHLQKLNGEMLARISSESERLRFVRIETNQGAGRDLIYLNTHPEVKQLEAELAEKKSPDAKSSALRWGKVKLYEKGSELWMDEIGGFQGKDLNRCGLGSNLRVSKN